MFINIIHLLKSKTVYYIMLLIYCAVLFIVIVISPKIFYLFIAVNLSHLSTDTSYTRQCDLRNHLFQQIQVPDLKIISQHSHEKLREREFCHLFICPQFHRQGVS